MMIFQNGVKWVCIFLFLLMLISDGTANANSLQESSVQRIHNSAERVVTNRQLSTNIEQQKSEDDADGTHSEVHEFQAHSDKNGVVLVPLDPRQAPPPLEKPFTHPTPGATVIPTASPTASPMATIVPYNTPEVKALASDNSVAVAFQPSVTSLRRFVSAFGIKPIAAQPTAPIAESVAQQTILTTSPQIAILPTDKAIVTARLFTAQALPLADEEIVLLTDDRTVQQGETDATGRILFQLPADLAIGDHTLRFIYAGQNLADQLLLPAVAESVIHYHTTAPRLSVDEITQNASSESPAALLPDFGGLAKPTASALDPAPWAMLWQPLVKFVSPLSSVWGTVWAAVSNQTPITNLGGVGALLAVLLLGVVAMGTLAVPALWKRSALLTSSLRLPVYNLQQLAGWTVPMPLWYSLRILSVGCALGLAIVLIVRPERGLFVFWRLFIPCVPLLFFVAPALWRNICPMAALNQTPRLFNFSQAWTTPKWMQRYGYLISIGLFLVLVSSRKVLFNSNGPALAILILCSLAAAFVMGNFFKGKSGWCSSICPLLPVQRIYGQTPFVVLNHAHCQPCLGCTKNCYDLSPTNAYLADLYDDDRQFAGFRKAFVALFPGFVLAFYLLPNPPAISIGQMYGGFVVAAGLSMASFFLAQRLLPGISNNKLTALYGALALNVYYWFNSLSLGSLFDTQPANWFVWSLRTLVFGLTLFWIYRTWQKEANFIELTLAPQTFHSEFRLQPKAGGVDTLQPSVRTANAGATIAISAKPVVSIEPEGKQITVENNRTLLEIIESNNLPIETGCRMGLCGADPICVHSGMENLSKVGSDERNTLERLALAPNTRMACMARVRGDVKIGLTPAKPELYQSSIVAGFKYDKSVQRVVIVGNGIAGVTAADHIRRRHPHCEIHLVGRERHHLYNRMGIARLIYGRSAMQGLYLLPEQWYEDFNITCWLNTHVVSICREEQVVTLGTGEKLPYDRLILTTGSQSFVPPIAGFGMAGSFVLRSADDAMAIRAYAQEQNARQAVVAGGGLLGLEAAYALHKLGLKATVLERSNALLTRQLDARSSQFLRAYLEGLGMQVLMEAEVAMLLESDEGKVRVTQIQLKSGQRLPCDLLLVAAGIAPDVELARSCGLTVKRAVIVDAQMRTNDPYIFAAGDVAEYDEKVYGLWPVAVSQAEIAAAGAVAGPGVSLANYIESAPVTMLKVAGIDVTSIGSIKAQNEAEEEIVLEDASLHCYRKLVVANGKIVGAILLNAQQDAPGVSEAIKQQLDITKHMHELRKGNWEVLQELA